MPDGISSGTAKAGSFINAFASFEENGPIVPRWVVDYRRPAFARFQKLGLPTRRHEEWKYTSVKPLGELEFDPLSKVPESVSLEKASAFFDKNECRFVFVDGVLSVAHSNLSELPREVTAMPLSEAFNSRAETVAKVLADELKASRGHAENPFAALNQAFLHAGAFVEVAKGAVIARPIHLVYVSTSDLASSSTRPAQFPRTMLLIGGAAQVEVIETYIGFGDQAYFVGSATDIVVGPNAQLQHCRVHAEGNSGFHVGITKASLARDARLATFNFATGGCMIRNDLHARLEGEGADLVMDGLYLARDEQHVDNHTVVEHVVPHASSSQLYKGIVDGKARAVFNGKVVVKQDAQQTSAFQLNRNLLLSSDAEVDTKPELQIDADDVKCSHGAAIGQLNRDEIFYMQSRGIPRDQAIHLLSQAFADEVLFKLPSETLRERLRALTMDFFK